jgi:hypothetical protein
MNLNLRTLAIAGATFTAAALLSFGWSEQGGVSLSVSKADAQARVYIRPHYAVSPTYFNDPSLPWYAVRAYYFGGPWSGPLYSYAGWDDYASRNAITCKPGSAVKGADGIMYVCQ